MGIFTPSRNLWQENRDLYYYWSNLAEKIVLIHRAGKLSAGRWSMEEQDWLWGILAEERWPVASEQIVKILFSMIAWYSENLKLNSTHFIANSQHVWIGVRATKFALVYFCMLTDTLKIY